MTAEVLKEIQELNSQPLNRHCLRLLRELRESPLQGMLHSHQLVWWMLEEHPEAVRGREANVPGKVDEVHDHLLWVQDELRPRALQALVVNPAALEEEPLEDCCQALLDQLRREPTPADAAAVLEENLFEQMILLFPDLDLPGAVED